MVGIAFSRDGKWIATAGQTVSLCNAATGERRFTYLEAGSGTPFVLLHGIGSAASGEECLEVFREARPDITLMDLQLGAMSESELDALIASA